MPSSASPRSSWHAATAPSTGLRLITSWLLPPLPLALIRLLIALYIFTTLFATIGIEVAVGAASAAGSSFTYFTILGYWGLGFYFLVAGGHTVVYAVRGRCGLAEAEGRAWEVLRAAHGALYATVTVFPFVVTSRSCAFPFRCGFCPTSPYLARMRGTEYRKRLCLFQGRRLCSSLSPSTHSLCF